jgi:hypothetical protein
MPRELHPENLRPLPTKTKAVQREIQRKGGIASGKAKKEKKLLSQIYAETLAEEFDLELENGEFEKLTGAELAAKVIRKIIASGGSPAVSMLKEIREGTEGSKLDVTADIRPWWPDELKGKIG